MNIAVLPVMRMAPGAMLGLPAGGTCPVYRPVDLGAVMSTAVPSGKTPGQGLAQRAGESTVPRLLAGGRLLSAPLAGSGGGCLVPEQVIAVEEQPNADRAKAVGQLSGEAPACAGLIRTIGQID